MFWTGPCLGRQQHCDESKICELVLLCRILSIPSYYRVSILYLNLCIRFEALVRVPHRNWDGTDIPQGDSFFDEQDGVNVLLRAECDNSINDDVVILLVPEQTFDGMENVVQQIFLHLVRDSLSK